MKRNITDVLRRGLDSTIANWPVIVLRIAESLVFAGIVIAAISWRSCPRSLRPGLSTDDIGNSSDPGGAVVEWLVGHLMLFVWIFALAFIVLGVMIAIHSFVEGGSAQIYVDGERAARSVPTQLATPSARFHVRSLAGRRRGFVVARSSGSTTWPGRSGSCSSSCR